MNIDHLNSYIKHLPVEVKDRTLIVLKGHLLLEVALKEYICRRVAYPDRIRKKQITFPSLISFASSLEGNQKDAWLWEALKKVNSLRNNVAHKLQQYDRQKDRELIDYVNANDGLCVVEVDDEIVAYEPIAISILQIFDSLIHAFPETKDSGKINGPVGLEEGLQAIINLARL